MYNYINLLLFNPPNNRLNANICSILNKSHLPFKHVDSIDVIIAESIKSACYAIIVVDDEQTYQFLNSATLPSNVLDSIHIIYSKNQQPISQFPVYYSEKSLYNLTSFLNSITPLHIPQFTKKIVSNELEKLNIPKKYTAFKYVVDIISRALYSNNLDPFSTNALRHIAFINRTSWTNVERDVRHMLTCNFNSNPALAKIIYNTVDSDTEINTKVVLLCLIKHIKSVI